MRATFLSVLLLIGGCFLSAQASAHDDIPAFAKQAQLINALINSDVYEYGYTNELTSPPARYADTASGPRADYEIFNPHGHIHWYKPYFNHTHANQPNPDHTHWHIQDYVAVDTLEPVTPNIVTASVSIDVL